MKEHEKLQWGAIATVLFIMLANTIVSIWLDFASMEGLLASLVLGVGLAVINILCKIYERLGDEKTSDNQKD